MAPGIFSTSPFSTSPLPSTYQTHSTSAEQLDESDLDSEDLLEPIAVVGLSLKFPDDATTPESFWKLLLEKRCASRDMPEDRANMEAFYHSDGSRPDACDARGGHFVSEDLGAFDAPFFSISSTEAASMDPQHRILLETAYRALENAGIPLKEAAGSRTGVYTGSFADDYKLMTLRDPEAIPKHAVSGGSLTMLAARLSWFFDLKGPCVNLDTACSSSMIALDQACQALRNGECSMALVGGSNTIHGLESWLSLSNMNFLSSDSRCYSFDHRANGYARGEGFGVVVLKPLALAIQNQDTIRGIIRATGSNQDGRTPGITQPSGESQEALIRATYAKAGLDPKKTRFFEAHGTGTALGDPTECAAIASVFGPHRTNDDPLYVGAVKSNIGHLEGASGIAGLIKTLLVLERGIIPPNANFERLNPRINAVGMHLAFPTTFEPFPTTGLRRASVNSFGFGGTNSHAVLDDVYHFLQLRGLKANHCTTPRPPSLEDIFHTPLTVVSPPIPDANPPRTSSTKLLVLSSFDKGGIHRQAQAYGSHFKTISPLDEYYIDRLAYTLANRRTHFAWRSFVLCSSSDHLTGIENIISEPVQTSKKLGMAMVFTGQGSQYAAMGQKLIEFPVFRRTLLQAQDILYEFGCHWSLVEELFKPEGASDIDSPELSQPLCTALQCALVELLRSVNVFPLAVVGHSSGEIAAAYAAGFLSLAAAMKVAYFRGVAATRLLEQGSKDGAMLAVGLGHEELLPYIHGLDGLSIACYNGPQSVTVSGHRKEILFLQKKLDQDNVFNRLLKVQIAYHSESMKDISEFYLSSIGKDKLLEIGCPQDIAPTMVSSVYVKKVSADGDLAIRNPQYWVDNLVNPVKFEQALSMLLSLSDASKNKLRSRKSNTTVYDIVEVGPHATLQGPVKDILSKTAAGNAQIRYTSLLRRGKCALTSTITAMGSLYCAGYDLNLDMINRPLCGKVKPQILSDLPEYPFDHSRTYWYESRISKNYRFRDGPRLELLGSPVSDWNPYEPRWRNFIRLSEMPWVNDHRINDQIVYPATGMLVMAIEAARKLARRPIKGYLIKEAVLSRALIISRDSEGIEVQTHLRRLGASASREPSSFEFACYSFSDGEWHQNCHGSIVIEYEDRVSEIDGGREESELQKAVRDEYSKAKSTCTAHVSSEQMYEFLGSEMNIHYATCFQGLKELAYNDQLEAIGEVDPFDWPKLHPSGVVQDHVIHPATMDAVAQLIFVALTAGGQNSINTTVPTRIERLWLSGKGANCRYSKSPLLVYAKSAQPTLRGTDSSVLALSKETQELVVKIGSLQTTHLTSNSPDVEGSDDENELVKQIAFGIDWKPDIDHMSKSELKTYCESSWKDETTEREFYRDLKLLLQLYINKAVPSVSADTSLPSHLAKFVKWMHWQMEKENTQFSLSASQPEFIEALAKRLEATNSRGKFFVKVGQSLQQILTGKIDPLEVIFSDGLADEYYREMFDCTSCAPHVGNYVDLLAHKNPSLKVVEIGGGTGGFTAHILQPLFANGQSRYQRYTFTDISPSFFERVRDRYSSQVSRMDFQTLDIEKDPKEQGFECGTYDVVVAGSVLHATADMRLTLANVRKLLKPGGKLIMFEIVKPEMLRAGFVFGLLEGWWLSKEPERMHGPCMTVETWDTLLKESGFSGTETVLRDYQDESCHETSIIVSTLCEEKLVPEIDSTPQHIIVTNSSCEVQKAAATELRHLIGTQFCEIVSIDQVGKVQDLQELSVVSLVELSGPVFPDIGSEAFGYLKTLLSASNDLLWVTGDFSNSASTPELEMVTGLARSLRSEKRDFKFITLALGCWETMGVAGVSKMIKECMDSSKVAETLENEMEFRVEDGRLCIPRMRQRTDLDKAFYEKATQDELKAADRQLADCPPVTLAVRTPGSLDSFCFVEDETHTQPLGPDEIEIEVQVVDINFMDVLTVMGQLNQDTLGGACAGYVRRIGENINDLREGDRVAACILGCMKTLARQRRELVVRIPNNMSWAEAAAIPCTCVTAYQGLVEFARLRAGETILIHSGAGGTGQSAIQLAQNIGAEIFTTVGSSEKKTLLMEQYGIPEDHIFYSRDTKFAAGVMRMTQQRGVDVVLNSLSDERLTVSWECMAPFGRFIEIGKKDIRGNSQLPMSPFAKNVSFHCLDLASMSVYRPQDFGIALRAVMELSSTGKLTPSKPLSVYPASKVPEAFRYLQSGKNMGKTVIELGRKETLPTLLKPTKSYEFDSNALYVIAGGLGGLGRSIARWMAGRGAKHLLLLSRSGPKHDTHHALLEELARDGVQIYAPACDITSREALRETLAHCAQNAPPIKGCIQATMVLQDCVFDNMSHQAWQTATRPKVQASFNLHTLLPDQLDFFILLSSVSGTIGSPAQSNYAAGNTYQDGLARHLLSRGCKAVALDLGWIASAGYVTEHERAAQNLQSAGFLAPIQQQSLLGILEYYCDPALSITELGIGQVVLGLEMPNTLKGQGKEVPEFMFTPAYRVLHMQNTPGSSKAVNNGGEGDVKSPKELLEAAENIVQGTEIVADALVAKLGRTLGLDIKGIGTDKPLYEYGVDSLSALEIKNWCGKVLGANVSVLELLGAESVGEVAVLVAAKSKFIHVS